MNQVVEGTTIGATVEADEFSPNCSDGHAPLGSVWYRVIGTGAPVAFGLEAAGLQEGWIDVRAYLGSQQLSLACEIFYHNTLARPSFKTTAGATYFVRVSGTPAKPTKPFKLRMVPRIAGPRKPGKPLKNGNVLDSVNLAGNPYDTWSVNLRAGTSYQFKLTLLNRKDNEELEGGLYPARGDFRVDSLAELDFDGYATYTPGPGKGGRYTLLVNSRSHGDWLTLDTQRYRLQAGLLRRDDTDSGVPWNGSVVRGHVTYFGLDMYDNYRLKIKRRSRVTLALKAESNISVSLYDVKRRCLGCGEDDPIRETLAPGTYYAAIRAQFEGVGDYKLTKTVRPIK